MYPVTLKTFPSPSWLLSSSTPPFTFAPQKHQLLPITLQHLSWFSADLLHLTAQDGFGSGRWEGCSSPPFLSSLASLPSSLLLQPCFFSSLFPLIFLFLSLSLISQTKYKWKSSFIWITGCNWIGDSPAVGSMNWALPWMHPSWGLWWVTGVYRWEAFKSLEDCPCLNHSYRNQGSSWSNRPLNN